jgi:predicted ATP-grasp superfamily ATP-dependent carboligase
MWWNLASQAQVREIRLYDTMQNQENLRPPVRVHHHLSDELLLVIVQDMALSKRVINNVSKKPVCQCTRKTVPLVLSLRVVS